MANPNFPYTKDGRDIRKMAADTDRLTYADKRTAEDIIRANAKVIEEPDDEGDTRIYVYYKDGWDDERVTKELRAKTGRNTNLQQIIRFRQNSIGRLKGGRHGKPFQPKALGGTVLARLMRAERQNLLLEQRLASVEEVLVAKLGYVVPLDQAASGDREREVQHVEDME